MREGGLVGIWETPFKNRMTPSQITNFFTYHGPPYSSHFLDAPLPPRNKLTLPQDFTFLIFAFILLLDVIVLTMKTKLTMIPILQRALRLKKTQIKQKRSQTLLFLGHCNLIKNKKQTAVINILNLHIFWLRLDVSYVTIHTFSSVTIEI